MPAKDPETRRLVASLGGLAKSAKYADRRELTRAATEAAAQRWERLARRQHPEADDAAIARIADALMRQHMARMALARRRAAQLRRQAEELESVAAGGE